MSDDETRAALRAQIDRWIADGARTSEPAIALLANLSVPPDVGVFDDAITRAGYPPLGEHQQPTLQAALPHAQFVDEA